MTALDDAKLNKEINDIASVLATVVSAKLAEIQHEGKHAAISTAVSLFLANFCLTIVKSDDGSVPFCFLDDIKSAAKNFMKQIKKSQPKVKSRH